MYSFKIILAVNVLLFTSVAHADLPLTVDDLLADKNRFKLDADLSYYNHHKSSVARYVKKCIFVQNPLTTQKNTIMPRKSAQPYPTSSLTDGLNLYFREKPYE